MRAPTAATRPPETRSLGSLPPRSRPPESRPPIAFHPPALRSRVALALGCHGNPDRCLRIGARRLTICARCTGIVVGNLSALPYFALAGLPGRTIALTGLALLLPAVVDGGWQAMTRYWSTNPRRVLTGVAFGFGQALVVLALVAWLFGLPTA